MPAEFRLNDSTIGAARTACIANKARRDIADPAHPGLNIRITKHGKARWVLSCRDKRGKSRRFPIGDYPHIGVAKARLLAAALRESIRQGADPIAEARRKRTSAKLAAAEIGEADKDTVPGSLRWLVATYRARSDAADRPRWDEQRRKIDLVFGGLYRRQLFDDLTIEELQEVADTHQPRSTARVAVQYLRPILKWAASPARNLCPRELAFIEGKAIHNKRDRVLTEDEMRALLPHMANPTVLSEGARPYATAMLVALLTASRRSEVGGMRWREIDRKRGTWTIPGKRHKNGQAKVIPLSRQVLAIIDAQAPKDGSDPKPDAVVFPRADGGMLGSWQAPTTQLMKASGTEGWTRHDLRRTASTTAGDLGVAPHIVQLLLGHAVTKGATSAYLWSVYGNEHRAALQLIADHVDTLLAPAPQEGVRIAA